MAYFLPLPFLTIAQALNLQAAKIPAPVISQISSTRNNNSCNIQLQNKQKTQVISNNK